VSTKLSNYFGSGGPASLADRGTGQNAAVTITAGPHASSDGGFGQDPEVGPVHTGERVIAPTAPHYSLAERRARGRAARKALPRRELGRFAPLADRPDPAAMLIAQNEQRVQSLVPVRTARMAVNEFAFFRGSAVVQAYDLGTAQDTTLTTQLCGDAHLGNLGLYATPERDIVFDLNDFDETLPGPFDFDLKRLVASFAVLGCTRALGDAEAERLIRLCVNAYCSHMSEYARMGTLDIWYDRIDATELAARSRNSAQKRLLSRTVDKAWARTSEQIASKLTHVVDGQRRFLELPPLLERVEKDRAIQRLRDMFRSYRRSLPNERRILLERYRFADMARKVVGVGSVGTRCGLMLLEGRDSADILVLQTKQAQNSVFEPYLRRSVYKHQGQRVVVGQRLMQAASDIFLGWSGDIRGRDYYLRQSRDGKYALDLSNVQGDTLRVYAAMCGWALARAHARAGDPVAIDSYLGGGETVTIALVEYASRYAQQPQPLAHCNLNAAKGRGGRAEGEQ